MKFRHWLGEMWMQHKDEMALHKQTLDYDLPTYFNRYKYWLKREYRHHCKNVTQEKTK